MTTSADSEAVIEIAQLADADAVGELFHEDMVHLGEPSQRDDQVAMARVMLEDAHSEDPSCLCVVARQAPGDEARGVLLANYTWSPKFAARTLWIETLYVSPQMRRRGLGRALVEWLLDWAEDHGTPGVDIEAYRGNTPASVLYRTMGFRRLGRERFVYSFGG